MKQYLLTIVAAALMSLPSAAQQKDTTAAAANAIPVKFSATVDMQAEKKLYDEWGSGDINTTRLQNQSVQVYRESFDDFWLRVALKGLLRVKYFESALNVRFYPYWTMRRNFIKDVSISGAGSPDVTPFLDILEVNQAYFKLFKEYSPKIGLTFQPHLKIGRDGLLSNCSQLFGNYLELPAGGMGDSRQASIVGPFKNRKVFANQLEVGFRFDISNVVSGMTSLMLGGNVNNDKWYSKMAPTAYYQTLDSRLSAGFLRVYQDIYVWNKRFHIGGGFRKYSAPFDSSFILVEDNYYAGDWVFDAAIIKDVKFYAEMAVQKMSSTASTGIVRPINIGLTLPTFGVVDTLAVEFENVAGTFFSDKSMRDAVAGRQGTEAFAWGIVVEKRFQERFIIDWGLYSGNPTGDMKTTLRLTSLF